MELIAIWVAFGVASTLALSRYKRGATGFLLGILLGPIGLAIALVMRSNAALDERRKLEQRNSRRGADDEMRDDRECPHCAEHILKKAKVCKHCGRDVAPIIEAPDEPWRWPTPD